MFDAAMLDYVIDAFGPTSFIESRYRYRPDGWCNSSRQESEGEIYFDIDARRNYDPDLAVASRVIVGLGAEEITL